MVIIGILALLFGLSFWVSSLWVLIFYRKKLKATIYELRSEPFSKRYPYRVHYTFNGVTYETDKIRGGFPLIGKHKIILIIPQKPEKVCFLVDVIFNHITGLFFLFLAVCWLLMQLS